VAAVTSEYELTRDRDPTYCGEPVAVGDLASNAKGSGARKNAGKPQVHQLPLWELPSILSMHRAMRKSPISEYTALHDALDDLGQFQRRLGDKPATLGSLRSAAAMLMKAGATIEGVAGVLEYGERKYKKFNWAKGMPWSVCLDCACRHILKAMDGKTRDIGPSGEGSHEWHERFSGKAHVDLALCNVIFLLSYVDLYPEGDDRPEEFKHAHV
jgi:hypothetical protein